jgi:hypothetical protein
MCFHIHTVAVSTCCDVGHVIKIGYLTLKQAQRNVAATKQSCLLKLTCGNSKTAPPT